MPIEMLTKEDLDQFKEELFEEIRKLTPHPRREQSASKEWLKSHEVRKILGISAGTLQRLRINGSLRYTKLGGLMFYRHTDIQRLMEEGLGT